MEAGTSFAGHSYVPRSRCPLCPRQFIHRTLAEVRRLRFHLIEDHSVLDPPDNYCPICRTHYSRPQFIPDHVRSKHLLPPWDRVSRSSSRPTIKCRICMKEIPRIYIKRHTRAHYSQTTYCALDSFKTRPVGDECVQISLKVSNCVKKKTRPGRESVALNRYSIYDVLGTLGRDYVASKGTYNTRITLYPEAAREYVSEIDIKEEEKEQDVINLDTDSDNETSRWTKDDRVPDREQDSSDSDVVLLDEENYKECKKPKLAKMELKNIEQSSSVKLKIKSNSIRSCEDSDAVAAQHGDVAAQHGDVAVKHSDVAVQDSDVAGHEDEYSEDDIVAELEQYIDENELLFELNSVRPTEH